MVHESVLSEGERRLAEAIAARSKSRTEGDALVAEVAQIFDVTVEAIKSESRLRRLVDARSVIATLLRDRNWTLEEIGDLLQRDHSTVCNLEQRLRTVPELRSISRELEAEAAYIYEPAGGWSR